ncbi:MAG: DNA-binding NarL/FixJ family response regulator, partial [Yoonia sp.]
MLLKKNAPAQVRSTDHTPRIGIIDDDPIAAGSMRARLLQKFSQCSVTVYDQPIVTPMLDVYCVDNDFNGQPMATTLLREIREQNPNALVVAMSSTLEQPTLLALMNGGCNAVYDKNKPHDCDAAFEVIANYLAVLQRLREGHTRTPFSGAVLSLRELLHEWNNRLSKN